jgi:hypothetical protein
MPALRFPTITIDYIACRVQNLDEALQAIREYYPSLILKEGSCGHWSFCEAPWDPSKIIAEAEMSKSRKATYLWDLRIRKPEVKV